MARNIIRDGYTKRTRLNAVQGLYEGLEISWRPMLPHQVDQVTYGAADKRAAKQYVAANMLLANAIARHLVEWDESDEAGNVLPIKPDTVTALPPPLFRRLFDVISGYDAGDLPTNPTTEEVNEYARDLDLAAATGKNVGEAGLEADAKNSTKG